MREVATVSGFGPDAMRRIELDGEKILLLRDGETFRAFQATCPHAGAPLEKGAICEGRLICPWHKAMFDVSDGALLEPPALDGLKRYPLELDGDRILVSPDPTPAPRPTVPAPATDARVMAIVGTGAAGVSAACALREFGFDGRVVLIGREPGLPYDRTALSKAVLGGKKAPDEVPPLREGELFQSFRIERITGEVERLDPDRSLLHLRDGDPIRYDSVLLAPGGAARRPDLPGVDLPGIHVLRTRDDAAGILRDIDGRPPVTIIGGGFIGLEAASALRQQKLDVTVVIPDAVPFRSILGEDIGARLRRLHEENGVRFVVGKAARFGGDDRVRSVVLEDGTTIETSLVLIGMGITPATAFATALHPAEDGGLDTDRTLRVRDAIFAAGDVARFPFGADDGKRIRVEHWRVAEQQGRLAARNMLGAAEPFAVPPFFWTMQHGKRIEVHGHPDGFDRVEIEGDLEELSFVGRQYRGEQLVGLIGCGRDTEMARLTPTLSARP